MSVTINYNVDSQPLKPLTSVEIHEKTRELETLTFFMAKIGKIGNSGSIKDVLLVKLFGNNYYDKASNDLYVIKSGKIKLKHVTGKDSLQRYDSYFIYDITPLKTIINLSKWEIK